MKISDGLAKRILISEAVIVILFGVLYSIHLGKTLVFLDERAYHSLAVHLAQNGSYTLDDFGPCTYWPPGYPALMSVFVYLGFSEIGLRLINFFALAGCLCMIFLMLRRVYLVLLLKLAFAGPFPQTLGGSVEVEPSRRFLL